MKKAHVCVCFTVILVWCSVILFSAIPDSTWTSTILNPQVEKNENLKARVTVGDFADKTASGGEESYWDDIWDAVAANRRRDEGNVDDNFI